jgi:hypothetical protein
VIGFSFSFAVDSLLLTVSLELEFKTGIHLKWTAFDALAGQEGGFLRARFEGERTA